MGSRKFLCTECAKLENPPALYSCPGCKKLKAADWYQKNKGKVRAWLQRYRKNNKETVAQKRREYEKKLRQNPEFRARKREYEKTYEAKNREKVTTRKYRWRETSREKYLASKNRLYSKTTYGEFAEAHRISLALQSAIKR